MSAYGNRPFTFAGACAVAGVLALLTAAPVLAQNQQPRVPDQDQEVYSVPEPALLTLFAAGLIGAGVSARRRLRNQQ